MIDPKEKWEECRRIIRDNVSPEQYEMLFAYTEFKSYANDNLILSIPSQFIYDMLEKDGGYIGCIYFSLGALSDADNQSAIDKGVDGGGAIEIYESVEDAKARCKYLSQYDSTIFYSGSYVIVGTMVIRVSYLLNALEQFDVTNSIILLFTQ